MSKDLGTQIDVEKSHFKDLLYFRFRVGYADQHALGFFGFGNASSRGAETAFRQTSYFERFGSAFHLGKFMKLGGDFKFETFKVSATDREGYTNVTAHFPTFLGYDQLSKSAALRAYLRLDTTNHRFSPTSGTVAEIAYESNREFRVSTFPYHNWSARIAQLLSFTKEGDYVLAGQAYYTSYYGDSLPIFHLARIGGHQSLRAQTQNRFVDAQALQFNGEFRWTFVNWGTKSLINRMELAPFVDLARVYSEGENISLKDFHFDFGVGARMAVGPGLVMRSDFGFDLHGSYGINFTFMYPF
jgi:outer membrane protein assembly factor BamA